MNANNSFVLKSDLLNYFTLLGYARLATPISNPGNRDEVEFKGFGISQAGEVFNKGWHFGIQDSSDAKYLQAFCTGSIFFEIGTDKNRLVLHNGDAMGSVLWNDEVPDWFPKPDYVIYENVDEVLTRELLKEYLDNNPTLFESLTHIINVNDTDTFLEQYFNMEIVAGIPVNVGTRIAVAGSSTEYDREVNIYIQAEAGSDLFIDPAIYAVHWENYFSDLEGHHLVADFKRMFGPLVANGVIRYVGASGVDSGDFLDPMRPAIDLPLAIGAAGDYDTILILDHQASMSLGGNYSGSFEVNKPLSITYLNRLQIDVTTNIPPEIFEDPLYYDPLHDPDFRIDLPILKGTLNSSVISIREVDGYVSISNLIITGGGSQIAEEGGGGILAYFSDKTYIHNCFLTRNVVPIGATALTGHGGGFYAYESSCYIFGCNVSGNESGWRGGGIFVGRYGWPVLRKNIVSFNNSGDGGGIAATIAYPSWLFDQAFDEADLEKARNKRIRIIENTIVHNTANDDGGGVYLSVMAKVIFKRNEIAFNIARGAGGAVRASLGSDIQMTGDSIHDNQASFQYLTNPEELRNGGGGIAARNSDLILNDVNISNNINHAFAGGGIYFSSSAEGEFGNHSEEGWEAINLNPFGIHDYDDILRNYFLKTEVQIEVKGNSTILENTTSRFESQPEDNRQGGGIYVVRYRSDNFTALPLKVYIENFTTSIDSNHNDKVTQVVDGVAHNVIDDPFGGQNPDSDEFHLYDMVDEQLPANQQQLINGIINTRTGISFLDAQNALVYQSLTE